MRTRGQERSAYALEQVCRIPNGKQKDDFASFSAGIPAMILQNGLGQTLAFLCAKGTEKHHLMVDIIKPWIAPFLNQPVTDNREFIKSISTMDQTEYLAAQQEVLRLLEWVKRYANAGL